MESLREQMARWNFARMRRPSFPNQSASALFALWFDPDSVVHGRPDALLAAKVSFRGLDRDVTKQKLYLFEFASRCVTQSRARPA
jgi:hypothetical protein